LIEWSSIKNSLPANLQEKLNAGGSGNAAYKPQKDEV